MAGRTSRTKSAGQAVDLDKSLAELENIVEKLESGDLPLDKSLQEFERGVRLSKDCQGALESAERRVQVLMGNTLQDFDDEPDNGSSADEAD
jgi:exodeoxyribonuclease VII small subunit